MRLIEIEGELDEGLRQIEPSASMSRYQGSERGGRRVLGAHVSIMVPERAFRPAKKRLLRLLPALFRRLYGPIRYVFVRRRAVLLGSDDTRYREIVLVEDTESR